MTAIAGLLGHRPDAEALDLCLRAMAAQRQFGAGEAAFTKAGRCHMAIARSDLLPQDRFDHQPLASARFALVTDLRLDNRGELIAALGPDTGNLRNAADSKILLAAWERWQEGCLARLVGPFAIACFDRADERLTLARDPLGERPLFFGESSAGELRFASMPSGVIAGSRPVVDLPSLATRLVGDMLDPPKTVFEDVRSLAPGQIARFDSNGLRFSDSPPLEPLDRTGHSEAQWIEEFRFLLDQAVTSQLRSSAPVIASQLSSGYDSSAVTCTAVRHVAPKQLIAFTSAPVEDAPVLTSANRFADESGIAGATALQLGIEQVVVRQGQSLFDALDGAAWAYQEPLTNLFNVGWWAETLRQAAARGASSMLIATGGNHSISFGGIGVLPYLLRQGRWANWLREGRLSVRNNNNRWRGVLMTSFEPWLPTSARAGLHRLFTDAPAVSEFDFRRSEAKASASLGHRSASLFDDRFVALRQSISGQFSKGHFARTGVEERDPTADMRLVRFCLSMPPELLLKDGVYRPLARKALADRVPRAVLDAPRRGYQGADWYARMNPAGARELLEEIAASTTVQGLLDLDRLRSAIERWPTIGSRPFGSMFAWGRGVTRALAAGKFIVDIERGPPA